MSFEALELDKRDGVAHLTLNRPDNMNAINDVLARELHEAALDCWRDSSIRAVLMTGAGKMFCAGGDLKFLRSAGDEGGRRVMEMTGDLHRAISLFNRMDAPLVIAVNGAAAGGGFSLAVSGDYVIAADSARFTLAYTAAGLSPDGSSTFYLPRFVGMRRARELMMTNRALTADEALGYDIVDRVVSADTLAEEAEAQARTFAAGPTAAYGSVKRLLGASFNESLESQMERESWEIAARLTGHDGQEGIAAFAEKRKPDFRGN